MSIRRSQCPAKCLDTCRAVSARSRPILGTVHEFSDVLSREKFAKHSADRRAAAFIVAFCDRATWLGTIWRAL
jgi:hypothetical protein